MMIGGLGETHWYDYRMGTHDIRLRDSCGYVDAVLTAGRRIWIVSFATEPMRYADRIVFNASVASLVLDPDAPLGTP